MAQSVITQVSKETDSYAPCPLPEKGEPGKKDMHMLLHLLGGLLWMDTHTMSLTYPTVSGFPVLLYIIIIPIALPQPQQ